MGLRREVSGPGPAVCDPMSLYRRKEGTPARTEANPLGETDLSHRPDLFVEDRVVTTGGWKEERHASETDVDDIPVVKP